MHRSRSFSAALPHINIERIRHLDIGEIGTDGYFQLDEHEVRGALMPFFDVRTLLLDYRHVVALCREDASDSESESDSENSSSEMGSIDPSELPLPNLDWLIIQNSLDMPLDVLREAWGTVFTVIEECIRAGSLLPSFVCLSTGNSGQPIISRGGLL